VALLFFAALSSCGKQSTTTTPTTPSSPTVPSSPTSLSASAQQRSAGVNTYNLQWTAPSDPSVTAFVVEAGVAAGASDIRTVETPAGTTSYSLTLQQRGAAFVRVRAKNAAGLSGPSNEVRVEDIADIIEALFLATGTLRSPDHQPICQFTSQFPNVVEGFARGTSVRVLISTTMPSAEMTAVQTLLDDMTAATSGVFNTVRVSSSDRTAMDNAVKNKVFAAAGDLVVLDVPDANPYCGTLGCGGGNLAANATGPLFQNGFVVAQQADPVNHNSVEAVAAHELGHAVGLCHCATPIMGEKTLMGSSAILGITRLSGPELAAIRSLYGASLGPGATKAQLVAAGLLN
jgi:hypothetical protein